MFGRSSSPRRNKLFAQHKALLVKSFKFLHVTTETIHLHRTFRTNANHLAPILHTLNEFELLIVLGSLERNPLFLVSITTLGE